jgi:hypothetical protein
MGDRALFVGFGAPVRGREERAVEVFGEFVGLFSRMQSEGRIEGMDVSLLGVVPARAGEGVGREMAMYSEAVAKVGIGGHALAGAHNGG